MAKVWRYVLLPFVTRSKKRAVHAAIFGKFRVKRRRHRFPLTDGDRIVAFGRDHFDSGTDAFDLGRADEDHLDRGLAEFALSRIELSTWRP